jgi:hypothetical protein
MASQAYRALAKDEKDGNSLHTWPRLFGHPVKKNALLVEVFFYSPWGTTSEGLVHDLQNLEGMLCAPRILIQRRL